MASFVPQTTTTSYGDLSLSALENLRNTVSALTATNASGQSVNLAEARRLLLDTYFQNLLDPLMCSVGNQTPSGNIVSLLQGTFVPLRHGSRIRIVEQPQNLAGNNILQRSSQVSTMRFAEVQKLTIVAVKKLLEKAWAKASNASGPTIEDNIRISKDDYKNFKSLGRSAEEFLGLWRWAHTALWRKSSPERERLEAFVGMRLEEWIGMKEVLNLPEDIPNYNAPLTQQEEQQLMGQNDADGLQRKRFEILNKLKKEMALDFMLVNKLHQLQRGVQLKALETLFRHRTVEERTELPEANYHLLMEVTNALLSKDAFDSDGNGNSNNNLNTRQHQVNVRSNLIANLLCSVASRKRDANSGSKVDSLASRVHRIVRDSSSGESDKRYLNFFERLSVSEQSRVNLLDEIKENVMGGSGESHATIRDVAKIIVLISYTTQIERPELLLLTEAIAVLGEKSLENPQFRVHARGSPSLQQEIRKSPYYSGVAVLTIALMGALYPAVEKSSYLLGRKRESYGYQRRPNILANNSKNFPLQKDDPNNPFDVFDSYNDKEISIKGTPFHGIMRLGWYLLRRSHNPRSTFEGSETEVKKLKEILAARPFHFLIEFLRHRTLLQEPERDLFVSMIFEYASNYCLHIKDMIDQDYGTNGLNYLRTKQEVRLERRREQNQREQRMLRSSERGYRGIGSVVQLDDASDATDCLDDFIILIEEICNAYPEQGRAMTNLIGSENNNSTANNGNGNMVAINVVGGGMMMMENGTFGNGWEAFLRFLWDKISSSSTDSMIYIQLFLPFLSMLTAMAKDKEVAAYVCNLLTANYSVSNEEFRDEHLATWSNIFGALRDYFERFRNKKRGSSSGNTNDNSNNLSSAEQLKIQIHTESTCEHFLRLIQAVISHKSLYQILNRNAWGKDSMRMDSIFFSLLSCKVRPPLKGELMRTLAIMVQHDYQSLADEIMSTTVWRYIAASEIVPNMKAQTNSGGNYHHPSRALGGGNMGSRQYGNMGSPYGRGRGMIYGNNSSSNSNNMNGRGGRLSNRNSQEGNSRMIETKTGGRLAASSNIKIELEEIESGDQEYPATCGFLTLFAELLRWGGPSEEAGIRKTSAGIQNVEPCLDFVWKDVFLNYTNRSYKNIGHRWEVAANCLAVFYRILASYEISNDKELSDAQRSSNSFVSLGCCLMTILLQQGTHPLLKKILQLINKDGGIDGLEFEFQNIDSSRSTGAGVNHGDPITHGDAMWRERAVTLALSIIRILLEKEEEFFHRYGKRGDAISLLSEVLLNSTTSLQGLARYIEYSRNAQINSNAVRIMQHIAHVTKNSVLTILPHKGISQQTQIPTQKIIDAFAHRLRTLNFFEETETIRQKRLAKFTCEGRLDSNKLWWLDANEAFDDSDTDVSNNHFLQAKGLMAYSRKMVLQLILSNLSQPTPNISHVLLGLRPAVEQFDRCRRSSFDDAVVSINELSPFFNWSGDSCFQAIIQIVDNFVKYDTSSEIATLCYRIIYELCKAPATSPFMMAHLRDHFDSGEAGRSLGFWQYHAEALLSKNYFTGNQSQLSGHHMDSIKNLFRWVLSGVALDMHLSMRMEPPNISHTANLMSLFYKRQKNNLASITMMSSASTVVHSEMPIIEILFSICSNRVVESPPTCPVQGMIKLAETCIIRMESSFSGRDYTQINIPLLYSRLRSVTTIKNGKNDLQNVQGRPIKPQEAANSTLQWAIKWNLYTRKLYLHSTVMMAWASILKTTFSECYLALTDMAGPCSTANGEQMESFVATLLMRTIEALKYRSIDPASLQPLAETITFLMARLRSEYHAIVMSNEQCSQILRMLVDVCVTKHLNAKIRCALFGALLHYNKYCQAIVPKAAWLNANFAEGIAPPPVTWEDDAIENEHPYEELTKAAKLRWNDHLHEVREIFTSTGDGLIEVLLHDAQSGVIGWRITALGLLQSLMRYDRACRWLNFIRDRGHLQSLLGVITEIDKSQTPELHVELYKQAMSFFLSIAQTRAGASSLLQYGLIQKMSECFSLRGPLDSNIRRHIMLPSLRVIEAMLLSSPKPNIILTQHALRFLTSTVVGVNRSPQASILHSIFSFGNGSRRTLCALKETAIVSFIVMSCAYCPSEFDKGFGKDVAYVKESMIKLCYRFSWVPRFPPPERGMVRGNEGWFHDVLPSIGTEGSVETENDVNLMASAPPSLKTLFWTRFDKMKWTAGRAILRHTASFFATFIRRIPGRENQLEISGFGRIVPLFILDLEENIRAFDNNSDGAMFKHYCGLGMNSFQAAVGSNGVVNGRNNDGIGRLQNNLNRQQYGLLKILSNVTSETIQAIEDMKQARMRIYEISQPSNSSNGIDGGRNAANLAWRPAPHLVAACTRCERHVEQILFVFENILGILYSHVVHYLHNHVANINHVESRSTFSNYIHHVLEVVQVLERYANEPEHVNKDITHPLKFASRQFIAVICLRLRNESASR
jgi:hypothetical protein